MVLYPNKLPESERVCSGICSLAKKELINYIEMKSGYVLDEGTEPGEIKFNIFDHQPRKRNDSGR